MDKIIDNIINSVTNFISSPEFQKIVLGLFVIAVFMFVVNEFLD